MGVQQLLPRSASISPGALWRGLKAVCVPNVRRVSGGKEKGEGEGLIRPGVSSHTTVLYGL